MVLNKIFKEATDFDQILKLEKSRKSGFKEFFLYFFASRIDSLVSFP